MLLTVMVTATVQYASIFHVTAAVALICVVTLVLTFDDILKLIVPSKSSSINCYIYKAIVIWLVILLLHVCMFAHWDFLVCMNVINIFDIL